MRHRLFAMLILLLPQLTPAILAADLMTRDEIVKHVIPPYSLGEQINDKGVWSLLNSGGTQTGYVFETAPIAPLPGFSGAPINMVVLIDLEGTFIEVNLVEHNEPIFVSGLGQAPFHGFMEQYGGHTIASSLVVGTPYGGANQGSSLVYLDGVTKATASVRIAHESILAATLDVVREEMKGIAIGPPTAPNRKYREELSWEDLVEQGIAKRKLVSNAEVEQAFAGTLWEGDDPEALDDPTGAYLDLWIVDLGPPSVARAVLSQNSIEELEQFLSVSESDEPILVIETARHGLVSDEFVRNTAPDWISARQGGLPVAIRDADLSVELNDSVPDALHDGVGLILRTDRRLGFDPTSPWQLSVQAVREHGMFMPQIGSVALSATYQADERFFSRVEPIKPAPPWLVAVRDRQTDLAIGAGIVLALLGTLAWGRDRLANATHYTAMRMTVLAVVTAYIGWWGQGQLSIVTVLAVARALMDQGSFAFLLYDPFSLLIWIAAIAGLFVLGRGLFCGWLCPFGALQEFSHWLGRALRLPQINVPAVWDRRLKWIKYAVLCGLFAVVFFAPEHVDTAAEVEPFKTAITVYFVREWYYFAYAAFWLLLGMVVFKSFCRYLCPLGAFMAIGGLLRRHHWIARRDDCGSPCQLCKVKCNYGAIERTGSVQYSECFGCLDCVAIYNDETRCAPLVVSAKLKRRAKAQPILPVSAFQN